MGVRVMSKDPAMKRLYELLWENPNWEPNSETGKEIKAIRKLIQGNREARPPKLDKIMLKDLTIEEYNELLTVGYKRKDIAEAIGMGDTQFKYLNKLRGFGNKYNPRRTD